MMDVISPDVARTLPGLFRERSRRRPGSLAYRYYDHPAKEWCSLSWAQMGIEIACWQAAIRTLGLQRGDRVAVMAHNSPVWVAFEQAALGLGLVVVPLFVNDRADNVAYVLADSGTRLLLLEGLEQWNELSPLAGQLDEQLHIWSINDCSNSRVTYVEKLLGDEAHQEPEVVVDDPEALATIVYTSGTTGRPKGVMLSHRNILWNAYAGLGAVDIYPDDAFLSFLPLSHTLERTIGYYLPMMAGASVTYARSIAHLPQDLQAIRPTVLISVPRIYERSYARIQEQLTDDFKRKLFSLAIEMGWHDFLYRQGREQWSARRLLWPLLRKLVAEKVLDKLGGRLRIAICGGAPLPVDVGKAFVGLGLNLLQGYGMTEASPVISVNVVGNNDPASVGLPLPDVEVRIGSNDELLARSPGVMQGYWNNPQASAEVVDSDGWLHTGDKGRIKDGHIYITGRIKDVIVLANGEKVSPTDMEMAIASDPFIEQVMVIGDNRPYLVALLVLNREQIAKHRFYGELLPRVCERIRMFPGYAQIRRISTVEESWTVENGLLTPTLKLKREKIMQHHAAEIEALYQGHNS
jgi:long-chain acyl-CoA synthetase